MSCEAVWHCGMMGRLPESELISATVFMVRENDVFDAEYADAMWEGGRRIEWMV